MISAGGSCVQKPYVQSVKMFWENTYNVPAVSPSAANDMSCIQLTQP